MNRVFLDTSAAFALLVSSDVSHPRAVRAFRALEAQSALLVTSSYVLVETYALLTRRVGLDAVAAFRNGFAPLLEVVWVDASLHERGLDLLLDRGSARLSLVDAVSFLVIQSRDISDVFAYDRDFEREGFALLE